MVRRGCLGVPRTPLQRDAALPQPTLLQQARDVKNTLYLALRLKPIVQLVTVCASALLVKFLGTLLNLLLNPHFKSKVSIWFSPAEIKRRKIPP
jgi:hypothetical protein